MVAMGPDVASWLRQGSGLPTGRADAHGVHLCCVVRILGLGWYLLVSLLFTRLVQRSPVCPLLLMPSVGAELDGMAVVALTGRLKASLGFRGSNNDCLPRTPQMDTPSKESTEATSRPYKEGMAPSIGFQMLLCH